MSQDTFVDTPQPAGEPVPAGPRKSASKGKAKGSSGHSPMMVQFWRAKKEQPDALLFFRMGDFYELFDEDAKTASRELGITLTARSKGADAIPMAGVPVRAMEGYLMKLTCSRSRVTRVGSSQRTYGLRGSGPRRSTGSSTSTPFGRRT